MVARLVVKHFFSNVTGYRSSCIGVFGLYLHISIHISVACSPCRSEVDIFGLCFVLCPGFTPSATVTTRITKHS